MQTLSKRRSVKGAQYIKKYPRHEYQFSLLIFHSISSRPATENAVIYLALVESIQKLNPKEEHAYKIKK